MHINISRLENIQKIADHYGSDHQHLKTIEELRELVHEIELYLHAKDKYDITRMLDEIADVYIMTIQIMYLNKLGQYELIQHMDSKIQRKLERIETEKYLDQELEEINHRVRFEDKARDCI